MVGVGETLFGALAVAGMLVACGLPASAAMVTPACGRGETLTSSVVEISVPPKGYGEIGLTMAGGQHYLLDGVVVPAAARGGDRQKIADLLHAMLEKPVQVRITDAAPDRRGRRVVELLDGRTSVAAQLAERGLVLASGAACAGAILAAEGKARAGQRGLWREAAFLHQAQQADMDLPDFAVITGKVLSVGQSGRTTYLNFGTSYRQDVTVRLPDATRLALEAAGVDVAALGQQQVEVRGYWMAHDGPELVLQHVEALALAARAGGGR